MASGLKLCCIFSSSFISVCRQYTEMDEYLEAKITFHWKYLNILKWIWLLSQAGNMFSYLNHKKKSLLSFVLHCLLNKNIVGYSFEKGQFLFIKLLPYLPSLVLSKYKLYITRDFSSRSWRLSAFHLLGLILMSSASVMWIKRIAGFQQIWTPCDIFRLFMAMHSSYLLLSEYF